jgi:DNA polymerase III delta subunit
VLHREHVEAQQLEILTIDRPTTAPRSETAKRQPGARSQNRRADQGQDRAAADGLGRIGGVVETLSSTYGDGARLGLAEIEPYLVEESDLAPWDLTDAIDKGDRALALDRLHRMLNAGRHPMQLMFVLHGHYSNLLELDGAEVTSAAEAAEKLGIRNGYPAQKALELSRRLRAEQVHEAITLLAEADLDLRGVKPVEYPVMEVLVARLASRCSTR